MEMSRVDGVKASLHNGTPRSHRSCFAISSSSALLCSWILSFFHQKWGIMISLTLARTTFEMKMACNCLLSSDMQVPLQP